LADSSQLSRRDYSDCGSPHRPDDHGQPKGEIANWDQILFPFDPVLRNVHDLASVPVSRLAKPGGVTIRERYTCDACGNLRVAIAAEPAGYTREFSIAQSAKG
jgi:molecular chaperone HscA